MTITEVIDKVAVENPWHAPGYFVVVYGWGQLVGWSVVALRSLSLFAGLIALSIIYNLGKRHFSTGTGIYAILTMGLGAVTLNFLHDMRTYALIVLFVALLVWAYEQVTARQKIGIWHYASLGFSTAALLYLHYFAAFAVAGLGLYHLIFRFRKPRYWQTVFVLALGGISFLPWVSVLLSGLALSVENPRRSLNMTPLEVTSTLLELFANGNLALMLLLGILALRTRSKAARFVWVWLAASTALAIIASRFFPALHDIRYMFFLWPGLAIIAGMGIVQLQRLGVSPIIIVGIWLIVFARQMDSDGPLRDIVGADYRPPFDSLAHQLNGYTVPADTLMYHLPDNSPNDTMHSALLNYYTASESLKARLLIPDTTATTDELYESYVSEAVENAERVWLAYERSRRNWRIGPVTEAYLPQKGFMYCGSLSDRDQEVQVELWAHMRSTNLAESFTFQDSDENAITLHLMQTPTLLSNHHLFSNLLWELDESISPSAYSLGLFVMNEDNQIVTQFDHGLDAVQGCLTSDMNMQSFTQGNYHLALTIYDWQTGERLVPVGQTHDEQLVDLGQFTLPD
jgi:hypothetical protein